MTTEEKIAYMLEVIQETKEYYADGTKYGYDPETDKCLYLAPNGNQCAFGRRCNEVDAKYNEERASILLSLLGKEILKDERDRELCTRFWDVLQRVHDNAARGWRWDDIYLIQRVNGGYYD